MIRLTNICSYVGQFIWMFYVGHMRISHVSCGLFQGKASLKVTRYEWHRCLKLPCTILAYFTLFSVCLLLFGEMVASFIIDVTLSSCGRVTSSCILQYHSGFSLYLTFWEMFVSLGGLQESLIFPEILLNISLSLCWLK